jgi:hypothetical protein
VEPRRENRVAVLIEIKVGFGRKHPAHFGQDRIGCLMLLSDASHRLEAGPAQAGWFEAIRGQPAQDVVRNSDFVAPTGPFIEFPFGDATLVGSAAKRACLVHAETGGRQGVRVGNFGDGHGIKG